MASTSRAMMTWSGMSHAYWCCTLCQSALTGLYRIELSCSIHLSREAALCRIQSFTDDSHHHHRESQQHTQCIESSDEDREQDGRTRHDEARKTAKRKQYTERHG